MKATERHGLSVAFVFSFEISTPKASHLGEVAERSEVGGVKSVYLYNPSVAFGASSPRGEPFEEYIIYRNRI